VQQDLGARDEILRKIVREFRAKGKRRKRLRWGLAQLMRPAKAASDVSFVCLPLCYPPNVSCNGLRGFLTRWCHANLRVNEVALKSLHRYARMSSSRTCMPSCLSIGVELGADA
jgi:hypothetical protein